MSDSESSADHNDRQVTKYNTDSAWADVTLTPNVKIVAKFEGQSPPLCCATLQSSRRFAVGWSDGIIEVRDASSFDTVMTLEGPEMMPVTCLAVNESDKARPILAASYASGHAVLWDARQGNRLVTLPDEEDAQALSCAMDPTSLAVGGSDGTIRLYDTQTMQKKLDMEGTLDPEVMDGHTDRVFALRFHPNKEGELVSGGWDDTVQFWDVRNAYSTRKIHGPHICGSGGIEFEGSESFFTASWRKRNPLQLWDYDTGEMIETLTPDQENCFLYCCTHLQRESMLIVGGSHKNMLRIIDLNSKMTTGSIKDLEGAVYFAKTLPKTDQSSSTSNVCFCSENSIYVAQIEN